MFSIEKIKNERRQTLSKILQKEILEKSWTIHGLAKELGVSYTAVRSWLREEATPGPSMLAKIADYLGVSKQELDIKLGGYEIDGDENSQGQFNFNQDESGQINQSSDENLVSTEGDNQEHPKSAIEKAFHKNNGNGNGDRLNVKAIFHRNDKSLEKIAKMIHIIEETLDEKEKLKLASLLIINKL